MLHICACLSPREFNIVSYTLLLSLIEFKTLVMRDSNSPGFLSC
jgi:hypothetical protein